MNTCYCTRMNTPHEKSPLCEIYRLDREYQDLRDDWDNPLEFGGDDDDYARQDDEARRNWRKV